MYLSFGFGEVGEDAERVGANCLRQGGTRDGVAYVRPMRMVMMGIVRLMLVTMVPVVMVPVVMVPVVIELGRLDRETRAGKHVVFVGDKRSAYGC